jgi:hypothetical protein
LIVALVTRGSLKSAILKAHPHYTLAQLHTAENFRAGILVIGALIAVGAWLWMAWANGSGRSWARGVSVALFVIGTLGLPIISFRTARNAATLIIGVLIWLVGLAVIVLIFNNSSGPFYRQAPSSLTPFWPNGDQFPARGSLPVADRLPAAAAGFRGCVRAPGPGPRWRSGRRRR